MAYADEIAQLQRRRALAQVLMQQGMQPQGQMAGRFYAGPTTASTLGSLASIIGGSMLDRKISKQEKTATDAERSRLVDALRGLTGMDQAATPAAAPPPAMPAPSPPSPNLAPNGIPDSAGPPSPGKPALAPTMPAPTASMPPAAPMPPAAAMDPKRAAALSVLQGLPVDQMQGLVGQAAVTNLFPKPKVLKEVDLGDKVGFADEAGNIVRTQPKGATPQGDTNDERNYARAYPKNDYPGGFGQWLSDQKKAGAPSVQVNTEKGLYGAMSSEQGKANVDLYAQAQKAPDLLQRAQRVKALIGPGSAAMTGAGADWKLAGAKIANQLGFNTGDAATDTEMLSRELASSTLESIKASGLGGGSGFSNADRDFLEKAVGGKITLEAGTLSKLADLNARAALNTIQRWNATASRLKPEELQALGMAKIEMPAGTPTPGKTPKLQKNPDGTFTYSP